MTDYIHQPLLKPEYIHPIYLPPQPDLGVAPIREEIVPYQGKDVLVVQMADAEGPNYVLVPGIMKDRHYRQEDGHPVSMVEGIKGSEAEKDLENVIRKKGFEGLINFR